MVERIPVQPALIKWGIRREGLTEKEVSKTFKNLDGWLDGTKAPTFRDLQRFAKKVHVPIGYLFLKEPPEEPQEIIPDFRRHPNGQKENTSPELRDAINIALTQQSWLSEFRKKEDYETIAFIGRNSCEDDPRNVASKIAETISLVQLCSRAHDIAQMKRLLVARLGDLGILVQMSGHVGSNNQRALDPAEFRGFSLYDKYAPFIFINTHDAPSAQLFSILHELAHLLLGGSALSAPSQVDPPNRVERWCNQVAAYMLMPQTDFIQIWGKENANVEKVAKKFFVSVQAAAIHAQELGLISGQELNLDVFEVKNRTQNKQGGGDYYRSAYTALNPVLIRSVYAGISAGDTTYTEGMRILGVRKTAVLRRLAEGVGV